ncbi:MAG TPA: YceI family protein [Verrucomicrobiae bacterium]|nr:YceI family protein [Verrucomicrobiae bacterium]
MKTTHVLIIGVVAGFVGTTGLALDTYEVDPAHSSIGFSIEHLVINTVHGRFGQFGGTIVVDPENGNALKSGTATIQATSIDTGISRRDDDLRSARFFDVAKYPTITFESKEVKTEGNEQVLVGNFTMHGVTREISLPIKLKGPIRAMGGTRLGLEANTKLNRKDYGLTYNKVLESGGLMLGEDVDIQINAEFVKQAAAKK